MAIEHYRWKPILDLGDDWERLCIPELSALSRVWREQKDTLNPESLKIFNEKLMRRFAIETGLIERLYTLDRGITLLLIERGIDAAFIPHGTTNKAPHWVAAVIHDQREALDGLFDFVGRTRQLNTSFIKELHAVLTRHQDYVEARRPDGTLTTAPLVRGDWKKLPNNPEREDGSIHEYCPPEHVASEMDELVRLHLEHQQKNVNPEVEAAWLHHRFTQIHPFMDGNGRVARCLASLVAIRAGLFPIVVSNDLRAEYVDALEAADKGDLASLVKLFATLEKKALIEALSLLQDVQQRVRLDQVIQAARKQVENRTKATQSKWEHALEISKVLEDVAKRRLDFVAAELTEAFRDVDRRFTFIVEREHANRERSHYFRQQVVQVARHLGYYAGLDIYHAWIRFILRAPSQSEIVVSFHNLGHDFRGVIVCSAVFFRREEDAGGSRQPVDIQVITDDIFQINYLEDANHTSARFETWLEQALIRGLEVWRAGL